MVRRQEKRQKREDARAEAVDAMVGKTTTMDFIRGIIGAISGVESALKALLTGDRKQIETAGAAISDAEFGIQLGNLAAGLVAGGVGARAGRIAGLGVEGQKLGWWKKVPEGGLQNRLGRFERKSGDQSYSTADMIAEIERKAKRDLTAEERKFIENTEEVADAINDLNNRPNYWNAVGSMKALQDAQAQLEKKLVNLEGLNKLERDIKIPRAEASGKTGAINWSPEYVDRQGEISKARSDIGDLKRRVAKWEGDVKYYEKSEMPEKSVTKIRRGAGTEDPVPTKEGISKIETEEEALAREAAEDAADQAEADRQTASAKAASDATELRNQQHQEFLEGKRKDDPWTLEEEDYVSPAAKQAAADRAANSKVVPDEVAERQRLIDEQEQRQREADEDRVDDEEPDFSDPIDEDGVDLQENVEEGSGEQEETVGERESKRDPIKFGEETEKALEGDENAKSRVKEGKTTGDKVVDPVIGTVGGSPRQGGGGPDKKDKVIRNPRRTFDDTVESTDEQGGSFTGTGKMAVRQILDRVNIDELLQKCLNLSLDTYNPDVVSSPEAFPNVSYYRNNRLDGKDFNVPFLIYTEGSELFVAFRGTSTLANVVTDISTSALGESLPNRIADYEFPVEQHAGRLEVHAGFLKAVHEIYSFLISRIKKVSVISEVHFTGHSLGGAVANLCAYIYSNDTDMSLPALGYAVSFGAPRMLFDKEDYKEDYMKSVPKCIRVWNTRDPVPYLPFKKPVLIDYFGTRMASGFTHVGKSFDLTSNQVNCNINVLLYLILMGNKSKVKSLLEQVPTAEANKLLDFMVTPDFQTLLLQGFFTCADRVSVNKGYTQEDIDFVMEQLQTSVEKLGSYDEKCERLRPYGLADMMKANNLTDDVQEENFCIPGIMGMCVGANKTMTEAHRGLFYKTKLTELIDKQAAEQKFIYEVEDKDHEVFIPTNDESVKELAETTQTKFERKLSMVRGLVYVDQKEMQMLNGQVIVY